MANWEPLSDANWAQARALFELLCDLPQAEQAAALAAHHADDCVVREVLALLSEQSSDATTLPLLPGVAALAIATDTTPEQARMGQMLGNWQLKERIGTGGMGEVFAARRADGRYDGLAAVKLLRPTRLGGADASEVLRRFALEQHALARLNHPHIARLLDAGQTELGEPYFVMELVDGQTITDAGQTLPLNRRLELFEQLTSAVAHAHSRLLVHRDLKPSNVWVGRDGQVKLLDFGISKALDPMESDQAGASDLTQQGQRPFTPAYASPEQVRGEPVTTATDVYSLGVLLYMLLTGKKPYGRSATTPHATAQAVLHEAPEKPSSADASGASFEAPDASAVLRIQANLLQGDLDNIVLKALAKAPENRYSSVEAFAADVRAFLNGRPVSAQRHTGSYVFKKWLARNKATATMAGMAIASVLVATGVALWQGHRAALAHSKAVDNLERLKSITRGVLYRVGNQISYLPGGIEIRAKMTQGLISDLEQLATAPGADPALQADLAQAWARMAEMQAENRNVSLAKNEEAMASAKRAIHWFELTAPTQNTTPSFAIGWGESWRAVANVERANKQVDAALAAQDQRLAILKPALARWPDNEALRNGAASAHLNKGQIWAQDTRTPAQAKPDLDEALKALAELVAGNPSDPSHRHQWSIALGVAAGMEEKLGNDAGGYALRLRSLEEMQRAVHNDPSNMAHRPALANAAANACRSGLVSAQKSPMHACPLTLKAYGDLIALEPTNGAWPLRRARATAFTAPHAAGGGDGVGARRQLDLAIAEMAKNGKGSDDATRLAVLRTERAHLASINPALSTDFSSDLSAAQAQLTQSESTKLDRYEWLMRARWFEVSAALSKNAAQSRIWWANASDAYEQAHNKQPLSALSQTRWTAAKLALSR